MKRGTEGGVDLPRDQELSHALRSMIASLRSMIESGETMIDEAKALLARTTGLEENEETYLRTVAEMNPTSWSSGWAQHAPARERLMSLGLVKILFTRACGMGDVDAHTCVLSNEGRTWLAEHPRGWRGTMGASKETTK